MQEEETMHISIPRPDTLFKVHCSFSTQNVDMDVNFKILNHAFDPCNCESMRAFLANYSSFWCRTGSVNVLVCFHHISLLVSAPFPP